MRLVTTLAIAAFCGTFASEAFAADDVKEMAPYNVTLGDRWKYQATDDIANAPKDGFTFTVTDKSDKDFTVTNDRGALVVFDFNGNRVQSGKFKFSPNDGFGLPAKAKAGSSWKQKFTWTDTEKNARANGITTGKCASAESITVGAGTFDALKCDLVTKNNAPNGDVMWENDNTFWWDLKTHTMLKRVGVNKQTGRVTSRVTEELSQMDLKN